MATEKIISHKVKHPETNEWIELMYINQDEETKDTSIYWKGALSDIEEVPLEDSTYRLVWG